MRNDPMVTASLETSINLSTLGLIYRRQGNYEQALEFFQRALAERKSALGSKDFNVVIALSNLASLFIEFAKYEAAFRCFSEATSILEEHPDHLAPSSMAGLDSMAFALLEHHAAEPSDEAFRRYSHFRVHQAKALFQNGQLREAIEACEVALRFDVDSQSGTSLAGRQLTDILSGAAGIARDKTATH